MPKEITVNEYLNLKKGRVVWYRVTDSAESWYRVDLSGTGVVEEKQFRKTKRKKYFRYSQFEKVACLTSDNIIRISKWT